MYRTYSDTCNERDRDRNDPEDAEDDGDRAGRYVGVTSDMFKSKSLNDLKPFYNGATLDERMAEIRKSIYYIRLHWEEYDVFLRNLEALLSETGKFKNAKTIKDKEMLLATKRDWIKKEEVGKKEVTYEAVRLYTSNEGYDMMYSISNRIFRSDKSIASEDLIRSVVFLVELINIDLYNYCMVNPEKKGFEGIVYRGLLVTAEDMQAYKSLRNCPVGKRNIAIPLGLQSSSRSVDEAKKFIIKRMEKESVETGKTLPLLIKIHVIGLKQEFVEHYTKTFPTAVLTTICAVDVQEISRYRKEREVLLHGPFLQVLEMYREENSLKGEPCEVMEVVMLNANRDHISTSFLGDQDGKARDLFGSMVAVTRSEFALKYCTEKELFDDAEVYRKILDESKEKLARLMTEN